MTILDFCATSRWWWPCLQHWIHNNAPGQIGCIPSFHSVNCSTRIFKKNRRIFIHKPQAVCKKKILRVCFVEIPDLFIVYWSHSIVWQHGDDWPDCCGAGCWLTQINGIAFNSEAYTVLLCACDYCDTTTSHNPTKCPTFHYYGYVMCSKFRSVNITSPPVIQCMLQW